MTKIMHWINETNGESICSGKTYILGSVRTEREARNYSQESRETDEEQTKICVFCDEILVNRYNRILEMFKNER